MTRRTPGSSAFVVVLVLLMLGLAASACQGSSGATSAGDDLLVRKPPAERVTLQTTSVPGLGRILTDGIGRVLYMFPPDAASEVRCVGPCAGTWPTLAVSVSGRVTTQGGVRTGLVGTLPDPNTGARVVTYRGNPLYVYSGDVRPGQANGQGLFLDGGPWYVLTPPGQPVTSEASGSGGNP